MNVRESIKSILLENRKPAILDSSISEIQDLIQNASTETQVFGYNVLDVVLENDTAADIVFTISLQHIKPNFAKYVDELIARGGKFARIYGDTPTSKTKITRWLTGFKEGADIDERQKSAAIKVAQLAGLDCINDAIISEIERDYACTCVANFTGAKTNKKGQSFFELFIFDTGQGEISTVEKPEAPEEIIVDNEIVVIEPEEKVPTKKPKKPRKKRKAKMPKLTSKQKRAGYNRINQQGHIRHVLEPEELDDISDHVVDIVLGNSSQIVATEELGPGDAADTYRRCRNATEVSGSPTGERMYRIVDDYYDNPLPRLVFYKCQVFQGGKIRSRSMMSQYTSRGSNRKAKGMELDPSFGFNRDGTRAQYTPPKLGGKEAKDARRYVNAQKASDELIIYALVSPRVNKYTSKPSIHTGSVMLYVFQLDRDFAEGE
jgi:hypothetical protein